MKLLRIHRSSRPRKIKESERSLGLSLAFASLLFGGTYSALAKGLTPFLSPMSLLIVSEGLTALFIVMTLGVVPLIALIRSMRRKDIAWATVVGVLNSGIAPLLWFSGLRYTTAINAAILNGADVLFMLVLGWWLLREHINRLQTVGALIVLGGVVLIHVANAHELLTLYRGDLFIFLGVGVFAFGAVLFKKHLSHVSAEAAIFIRNIVGMLGVLIVSLLLGANFLREIGAFPREGILLLLAFGFFARYLHLTLFYEALDRLPAIQMGLIDNAMPLSGVLAALLILGEQIQAYQFIGVVLIVTGLTLEHVSAESLKNLRRRAFPVHFSEQR